MSHKTIEIEILKEALDLAQGKKPILLLHSPPPGTFPVKTEGAMLEIALTSPG